MSKPIDQDAEDWNNKTLAGDGSDGEVCAYCCAPAEYRMDGINTCGICPMLDDNIPPPDLKTRSSTPTRPNTPDVMIDQDVINELIQRIEQQRTIHDDYADKDVSDKQFEAQYHMTKEDYNEVMTVKCDLTPRSDSDDADDFL